MFFFFRFLPVYRFRNFLALLYLVVSILMFLLAIKGVKYYAELILKAIHKL